MSDQPPIISKRAQNRRWHFWLVAGLVVAGLVVVAVFDPMEHGFYPKCMLHTMTGWSCPGCGTLRALHALLNGDVAGAYRFNPLIVAGTPVIGLVWLIIRWRGRPRTDSTSTRVAQWLVWCGLAIFFVFGILRNVSATALWWWSP